jgi:hypothetical protein
LGATGSGKGEAVALHAMMIYEEVEIQLQSFLTLAIDGDEWSASQTSSLCPVRRALGNHSIGNMMGDVNECRNKRFQIFSSTDLQHSGNDARVNSTYTAYTFPSFNIKFQRS